MTTTKDKQFNLEESYQAADDFLKAYIECALWSSVNDKGVPLDRNYTYLSLAKETFTKMKADCDKFRAENPAIVEPFLTHCGHDFWWTRNHHGTGFWDRDFLGKEAKDSLTKAAHKFGECDLYVDDTGELYI